MSGQTKVHGISITNVGVVRRVDAIDFLFKNLLKIKYLTVIKIFRLIFFLNVCFSLC